MTVQSKGYVEGSVICIDGLYFKIGKNRTFQKYAYSLRRVLPLKEALDN